MDGTSATLSRPNSDLPRVSVFGTFDVMNYGDLLFPHLLQSGLAPARVELAAFSPSGETLPWADTYPTRPATSAPEFGAMLHVIGGGNIIHCRDTALAAYAGLAGGSPEAYASLWLGAGLMAVQSGARLAWNAPGAPAALRPEDGLGELCRELLAASDYVSFRDAASLGFLDPPDSVRASVVPDTALDIGRVWPAADLREHATAAFSRHGLAVPGRWAVFHVNSRYSGGDAGALAGTIERIACELSVFPVLVALGPCHGDDVFAREVGALFGRPALVLDSPLGLKEMAALIAHASFYCGSSLHGLITALSYGRPALGVARKSMVKFSGFLDQVAMPGRLVETWPEAEAAARSELMPLDRHSIAAIARAQERIGEHWHRIRLLLAGSSAPASLTARKRILDRLAGQPEGQRTWRGLVAVPGAGAGQNAVAAETGKSCCICGTATFRAGPAPLPGLVGFGQVCAGCGSPARHRALYRAADALRTPAWKNQSALCFGAARMIAKGWFGAFEDLTGSIGERAAIPREAAAVDLVACLDLLERAPDAEAALREMWRILRPGGLMLLSLRNVPGRATTLDWGFPRGDRYGEWRMFGADFEARLSGLLPGATVMAAAPVDPVTDLTSILYVIAHGPAPAGMLASRGIECRIVSSTRVGFETVGRN